MRVLLAYGEHGRRAVNDFNWCNPLEPVVIPHAACDNGCNCGCSTAFTGISSRKGTTLALVVDLPIPPDLFTNAHNEGYIAAGFMDGNGKGIATDTLHLAARFPVGTIVKVVLSGSHIRIKKVVVVRYTEAAFTD